MSASVATYPRPPSPSSSSLFLRNMPFEIALQILSYLNVKDVLAASSACHFLYDVSRAGSLWRQFAHELMCRGRRIFLHEQLLPSDLSTELLRTSVLKSVATEHNWRRQHPRKALPSRMVKLDRNVVLDQLSYVMKYASPRHLVLPTVDGELVGWDMDKECAAGRYAMGRGSALISVRGDYASRSLYWITGRHAGPAHDMMLKLVVLRVKFPRPDTDDYFIFEELTHMFMQCFFTMELRFLDIQRKMLCTVFMQFEFGSTGLVVFLNWDTGLCAIVDLGLPYELDKTITDLQLSSDGEEIIMYSDEPGEVVCRFYTLSEIIPHAFMWEQDRSTNGPFPLVQPNREMHFKWADDIPDLPLEEAPPPTVWVLPQWWPSYPGVPKRTSTIILYLTSLPSPPYDGSRCTWRAVQYYSNVVSSETGENGGEEIGPCANARCVIEIDEPVLIPLGEHGLPILTHSFNHLGWIEERDVEVDLCEDATELATSSASLLGVLSLKRKKKVKQPRQRVWRKRRALKLVTFPDPGSSLMVTPTEPGYCYTAQSPVTLDVPEHVLDEAYHVFIDPAAGSITVATIANALHVFHYA